ncbi:MAG TPA: TonB-dependent receptor [Gemmatimonadaceae bacterium]|nr:TonB-dependent receptor [Gemmatimonadaceae bacterium]
MDTGRVRRDTTLRIPVPQRADSLVRRDSTGLPQNVPLPQPRDTVKEPLAHAPVPRLLVSERSLRLSRAEMFATGALTLQDLLERVMGVTPISTGFISAPTIGTVAGDARRVRVFIDGIEYDALDPRGGEFVDLSQVPIWIAEDVTIERAAIETKVHLRTWRAERTDDYTRTDIGTGDQQTNLYRAFYGRRMQNGGVLQLGAQQYSTTPPSYLGSSADQLGLMARVGWAGRDLKVDGLFTRVSRNRGDIRAFGRIDSISGIDSRRLSGMLRVGFRDPDTSRVWAQVVGSPTTHTFELPSQSSAADTIDTDTTRTQLQVFGGVGMNAGPFAVQAMARARRLDSTTLITPVLSASYIARGIGARAGYEGAGPDSLARLYAIGEVLPLAFIRLGGAVDHVTDTRAGDLATLGVRAWAGLRLKEVWLDVGVIRRDSTRLLAPALIDAAGDTAAGAANGLTAAIEGRVWRSLHANIWAVKWADTASVFRPEYQTRSELFVRTGLPRRFPAGNFGFLLSLRHEYRSATLIPSGPGTVLRASGDHAISSLLEIRIATAVISWQVRNVVGSRNYQAPDYLRPRTINFYGVRWEFWN